MMPRLKAAIWVDAEIRRCRVNGIDAYLVRRGDEHAGAILIKHNRFEAGCHRLCAHDIAGRRPGLAPRHRRRPGP